MTTAGATAPTAPQPNDDLRLPSRHRTVSVRAGLGSVAGPQRLRVSVEHPGRGTPLLLINGLGATGDLFDPLRRHLDDRETIAFDAPGVGGSPAGPLPRPMCELARLVDRLVVRLGHERVDVLGLSWGGALAQELAIRHPARVRRLILAATLPGWGGVFGRPGPLSVLLSPARYYSPDYLRRIAPTLYGGGIADRPDLLDSHVVVRTRRRPSIRGYAHQLLAVQTWTSLPNLRRIAAPTLVLAGDDDPIVPPANGRILARAIPDAHLHLVEGGGHLFLFVRAERMAATIRRFLDSDGPTTVGTA